MKHSQVKQLAAKKFKAPQGWLRRQTQSLGKLQLRPQIYLIVGIESSALKGLGTAKQVNETLLYIAAFNEDQNEFSKLVKVLNEKFYDVCISEFSLPADKATQFVTN